MSKVFSSKHINVSEFPKDFIPVGAEPFYAQDKTATAKGFYQNGITHIQEVSYVATGKHCYPTEDGGE